MSSLSITPQSFPVAGADIHNIIEKSCSPKLWLNYRSILKIWLSGISIAPKKIPSLSFVNEGKFKVCRFNVLLILSVIEASKSKYVIKFYAIFN